MKDSIIGNDQTYDVMGNDISCNLGSTNVVNLMASPDFGKSVRTMLRALTFVTDSSAIDVVPTVKNGNDMYHSVGLGAMNLHGYFAKNQMHYGSPESIEFTEIYFMLLNYWTLVESNNISIERKQTFHDFEKSDYANGAYFDRYLAKIEGYDNGDKNDAYEFQHERVAELFQGVFIPSLEDWRKLKESVMKYGIYNALIN